VFQELGAAPALARLAKISRTAQAEAAGGLTTRGAGACSGGGR